MPVVPDHRFYYLSNFQQALAWLAERYADLLSEEECAFLQTFAGLPLAARALFVRMMMRRGEHFRTSRLDYPEIGCPLQAAQGLPSAWVEQDAALSLAQVFALATKPELVRWFGLRGALRSARKEDLLAALAADPAHAEPRRLAHWMTAGQGGEQVLFMRVSGLCERLRLMFFGNLRQDWSEFVLADLGTLRYEQIALAPEARGFRSRGDIDLYLQLRACKERYSAGEEATGILAALPSGSFDNPWLESRRERLLFQLGQQCEKAGDLGQAQQVYLACRYPGARARAIRVLEKQGRFGPAHALLKLARQAPESEAERQQLLRIAPRLARQLGLPPALRPRAAVVPQIDLVLPPDGSRVERAVQAHLQQAQAPVFYVENALANTLFGLLCWEAIFAAIPGAFFHPFQREPADLLSADFAARRREQLERCLGRLDDGSHRAHILATYEAKQGLQSPFVAWGWITREILVTALDCIPAAHLKLWCLRILEDVRENRNGFPDLVQFWQQEGRYRMIEVKGPGDRLQDNQRRWLDYCAQHAMPVAVCYLQWEQAAA